MPSVYDDDDGEAQWTEGPEAKMHRESLGPARDSIVNEQEVPLDEYHECPWCLGKGFVHVTQEPNPRKRNRLMKGPEDASS
jgi:hypothetical protein